MYLRYIYVVLEVLVISTGTIRKLDRSTCRILLLLLSEWYRYSTGTTTTTGSTSMYYSAVDLLRYQYGCSTVQYGRAVPGYYFKTTSTGTAVYTVHVPVL